MQRPVGGDPRRRTLGQATGLLLVGNELDHDRGFEFTHPPIRTTWRLHVTCCSVTSGASFPTTKRKCACATRMGGGCGYLIVAASANAQPVSRRDFVSRKCIRLTLLIKAMVITPSPCSRKWQGRLNTQSVNFRSASTLSRADPRMTQTSRRHRATASASPRSSARHRPFATTRIHEHVW